MGFRNAFLKLLCPPRGYSFFPTILKSGAKADIDASHKRAEKAAVRPIRVPERKTGVPDHQTEEGYLKHLRQYQRNGFTLLAIDTRTNEAKRLAVDCIKRLPQTFRQCDRSIEWGCPTDQADLINLDTEERRRTTLKKPVPILCEVLKKRTRKGRGRDTLVDEKLWDFERICNELADLDEGKIEKSDFVERIILLA